METAQNVPHVPSYILPESSPSGHTSSTDSNAVPPVPPAAKTGNNEANSHTINDANSNFFIQGILCVKKEM